MAARAGRPQKGPAGGAHRGDPRGRQRLAETAMGNDASNLPAHEQPRHEPWARGQVFIRLQADKVVIGFSDELFWIFFAELPPSVLDGIALLSENVR